MRLFRAVLLGLVVSLLICGCQSAPPPAATPLSAESKKKTPDPAAFNNSLALLDDLLNDEKNISKLLIIKHNTAELGRLAVNISKTSGNGQKLLESIAKNDTSIDLKAVDLPAGEKATRKAIAKTKEHVLLHSSNAELEFQLLMTQAEALNYGAHLAAVATENDTRPERGQQLLTLSNQLKALDEQVLVMLRRDHQNQK